MTIGLKTMLKIMFFTSVVYLFTVAEKQIHEDSSHFAVVVLKSVGSSLVISLDAII
jgi:hypothetical protein